MVDAEGVLEANGFAAEFVAPKRFVVGGCEGCWPKVKEVEVPKAPPNCGGSACWVLAPNAKGAAWLLLFTLLPNGGNDCDGVEGALVLERPANGFAEGMGTLTPLF